MTNTLNAATNAAAANDLLAQALDTEDTTPEPAKITAPSEIQVNLPGGYVTTAGEVYQTATVRELTGKDEEVIVRGGNTSKVFSTILQRGTVSIGGNPVTDDLLDNLLIGDRETILLGIYRMTFGDVAELGAWCSGCGNQKIVGVDITQDIKTKVLVDPIGDRKFLVQGRKNEFLVALPTGMTEKKVANSLDANPAEALSILLENTVVTIDGRNVITKAQVQNLGVVDRRTIADAIAARNPGPQFEDITVSCPDCEGEVRVPISLGTLFRF